MKTIYKVYRLYNNSLGIYGDWRILAPSAHIHASVRIEIPNVYNNLCYLTVLIPFSDGYVAAKKLHLSLCRQYGWDNLLPFSVKRRGKDVLRENT